MPAQSHHILLDINITVWFDFDRNEKVVATPGWVLLSEALSDSITKPIIMTMYDFNEKGS